MSAPVIPHRRPSGGTISANLQALDTASSAGNGYAKAGASDTWTIAASIPYADLTGVQASSAELTALAALASTGFLKRTGSAAYTLSSQLAWGTDISGRPSWVTGATALIQSFAAVSTPAGNKAIRCKSDGTVELIDEGTPGTHASTHAPGGGDSLSSYYGALASANVWTAKQLVDLNTGTPAAAPTGTVLHGVAADGDVCYTVLDAHSDTASIGATFEGRRSRNTCASPASVQSGDVCALFTALGYGTTDYGAMGGLRLVATETHSDTSHGSKVEVLATPNGATARTTVLRIRDYGISVVTGADPVSGDGRIQLATGTTKAEGTLYGDICMFRSASATMTLTTSAGAAATWAPAALPAATTSAIGAVELATDGESASGVVVQGNDSRLSNARTPSLTESTPSAGTAPTADLSAQQSTTNYTLNGNPTFATSNRAAGRWHALIVTVDGSARTPTFPSWVAMNGTLPTSLSASKKYTFVLHCLGSAETNVQVWWTES